jgi:hypothetical protein
MNFIQFNGYIINEFHLLCAIGSTKRELLVATPIALNQK